MSNVTAIIAARGGSVRLPGKALLPFAGTTMIGHRIDTLKLCPSVTRIVVNTDAPLIRVEAIAHGAEAIEGLDYHDDTREMIRDSCAKVRGKPDDLILWAHPTNPLISAETYERAIAEYRDNCPPFDSLCSVYTVQRHAWVDGRPLNYNPWSQQHTLARDLKPVAFQDGAIFIQPLAQMLANRYFFARKPLLFVTPENEVGDVDVRRDYENCLSHSSRAL